MIIDIHTRGGSNVGTLERGRRENRRQRRAVRAGVRVALLALFGAPTVAAQDAPMAGEPGVSIELTGYAGAILPLSSLGAEGDSLRAELSTRPSFAAGLDVWFTPTLGLGLMAGYSKPELNLTTAGGAFGQETADLGSVDYMHGEALLVFRPVLPGSSAVLLPFVGVGAGLHDLSMPEGEGFEDSSGVVIVVAGGTHLRLSDSVHLRLDVRDLISSFDGGPFSDSNVQHDVFVHVGVGVGL